MEEFDFSLAMSSSQLRTHTVTSSKQIRFWIYDFMLCGIICHAAFYYLTQPGSFSRNITIFGIHFLSFYFLQLPAFFGQFVCKRSNKIVAPSFVYMPSLSSEFLSLHEIKKGSWLCRHKIHGGKIYDFFVILFPAFFKQGSRKIKF